MANYEVDGSYKMDHYFTEVVEADDPNEAETKVRDLIIDENPEAIVVEIDAVREIKKAA